jgi:hypothetical protein
MNQLASLAAGPAPPVLVAAAGERAGLRFLEFFAAIRNPHTRRAYARAAADFLAWCEAEAGVRSLAAVQPLQCSRGSTPRRRRSSASPRCATCSTGWSPARCWRTSSETSMPT